jgi:hypothetical protein
MLPSSGYVLANTPANEERLQWLAREVGKHKGQATIVQAQGFDGRPASELIKQFIGERSREYTVVLNALRRKRNLSRAQLARIRRRFQQIVDRDTFHSPLREKVEALLATAQESLEPPEPPPKRKRKEFQARIWVTRHRPGIDRVASAWLIRRFIDSDASFVFADNPREQPTAIPFDMFSDEGFGHRGEDCSFETLMKDFGLDDHRVKVIAEAVHDADLGDEKYGRDEAVVLERVISGWAQQGISDDELLRRGMELFEGLYQSL